MDNGHGLLERERVTAAIRSTLDRALDGRGGGLFILGEPGLGKTSLLEHARAAATALRVSFGFGRGDVMEATIPFGLLGQALDHLGGPELSELGEAGPSAVEARAAQFHRTLRWMQALSEPVLVALDDVQWADADSLALLSFVSRRLTGRPIAVIATLRPWPHAAHEMVRRLSYEGLVEVERLEPLSEPAAAELIERSIGEVSESWIHRAWSMASGNPLLLQQLLAALDRGEDVADPAQRWSLAASDFLVLGRFAGIGETGVRCAQAAGVLGIRFRPAIAAEVAVIQDQEVDGALRALTVSGIVREIADGWAEFVHPAFHQALYDDLPDALRRRLHARAFAVLVQRGMEVEAAEHAVRADLRGDPGAVAVLTRVGRLAMRGGALASAAARLEAALSLAGETAPPDLLVSLGETLLAVGRFDEAVEIFGRLAERDDVDYRVRADALRMMGRALVAIGAHDAARASTERAVLVAEAADPGVAAEALLDLAFASWVLGGPVAALPVAERARRMALPVEGLSRARAQATWAFAALQTGDSGPLGQVEAEAPDAVIPDLSTLCSPWGPVSLRAAAAMLVERLDDAEGLYRGGLTHARRLGAVQGLVTLAAGLAEVLVRRGRVAEAVAALSDLDGYNELPPSALLEVGAVQASILLLLGQVEQSLEWCARVETVATDRGEWFPLLRVWTTRVEIDLAAGDGEHAAALARRIEQVAGSMGLAEPCAVPWAWLAISAHLAVGAHREARQLIGWLDQRADGLPCRWPRMVAEAGRSALAEHAGDVVAAQAHLDAALRLLDGFDLPLERIRALLAAGRLERRRGRPSVARPLFAEAARLAEAAGAPWLAEQAVVDLRVAGGRRRRSRYGDNELTGQERRVAELAGSGRSNDEIALRLNISVSTVKTHLGRVYAKLGVSSRRHLISMARDREEWVEVVSADG